MRPFLKSSSQIQVTVASLAVIMAAGAMLTFTAFSPIDNCEELLGGNCAKPVKSEPESPLSARVAPQPVTPDRQPEPVSKPVANEAFIAEYAVFPEENSELSAGPVEPRVSPETAVGPRDRPSAQPLSDIRFSPVSTPVQSPTVSLNARPDAAQTITLPAVARDQPTAAVMPEPRRDIRQPAPIRYLRSSPDTRQSPSMTDRASAPVDVSESVSSPPVQTVATRSEMPSRQLRRIEIRIDPQSVPHNLYDVRSEFLFIENSAEALCYQMYGSAPAAGSARLHCIGTEVARQVHSRRDPNLLAYFENLLQN